MPEADIGVGIDAEGGKVIDPTKNVETLVAALRDTLREFRVGDHRYLDSQLDWVDKLAAVTRSADTLRQDDLRAAETKREDDLQKLRSEYELRIETQRITYEQRIADIISAQTDKSALLLSTTVDKLTSATNERISAVEKNQYVAGGKTSVMDPAIAEAMAKLAGLTTSKDTAVGWGQAAGWIASALLSVALLVVAVLALKAH